MLFFLFFVIFLFLVFLFFFLLIMLIVFPLSHLSSSSSSSSSSFSVAGRRPCLARSLWSSLRAERALASVHGDGRRARDARGARASRVVLAAAVEHGCRACGALFSSLLLSFCRAARGAPLILPHAGGGARITSGRAAHATRDATRTARRESERRAPSELAVRISRVGWLVLPLLSRCAVSRAPLPRSAARRGRAHHARARGARSARRDARGAWGVRAPRALGARGPCSRSKRPSWASPCSARAPAPFAPLPETAGGRGARATSGRATHAARGVAHAACGGATGSPLSFVAVRGPRVFSVFLSSPLCAPRCSLAPRRGGALARAGTRRTRDLRVE